MRTNKVYTTDMFTYLATEEFKRHIKTQSKNALEILDKSIDWEELVKPIERELSKFRSKEPAGRPPYPTVTIVKCFLLQHMYDLSDPRLEEEIADRRSFQMFLHINNGDSIPDETTICINRKLYAQLNLDKLLFESFNNIMREKNMLLERGTLVDATIKQAQATPKSGKDKDARHTKKRKKSYYGYKGHIGVDLGTDVIQSVEFTPANVSDMNVFETLLNGKEQSVYADKGYTKEERKKALESKGIFCGILEKAYRNKPLTKEQIGKNKQKSRIRNIVERPFAYMKRILKYDRCRYYDINRNRFEFIIKSTVYNMRRFLTLSNVVA
jgi:IS5 family transposase